MKYNYLARNKQGEIQTGEIESVSESAAIESLQTHNLVVVAIESTEKMSPLVKRINIFQRISRKEIVIFCRQLAILVGSDVSIIQALRSLAAQTTKASFSEIITQIALDVESGMLLSKAMSKYPKVFSSFYINLLKSGEATGRLQSSLEFLAEHLEKQYYLVSKIQRALYYPGFILGGFVIVIVLMMIYVVPGLTGFLEELDAELPLTTRIVIQISDFMVSYSWLIILGFVGVGLAVGSYLKTSSGKLLMDHVKIKAPVFGKIMQQTYLAHWTKNLGTLIKGNLPIIQALDISAKVANNSIYEEIIYKTKDAVARGNSMSSVLEKESLIPPVVTQMIKTGEQTGRLDYVLINLADFYSREVDNVVDNVSQLIEPFLIVGLGGLVAGLMVSILMPIYSVAMNFQ